MNLNKDSRIRVIIYIMKSKKASKMNEEQAMQGQIADPNVKRKD